MPPFPLFQLVIAWRHLLAPRTAPRHPGVPSHGNFNPLWLARSTPQPDILENESGMGLNLVQNRFNLQLNGWSPRRGSSEVVKLVPSVHAGSSQRRKLSWRLYAEAAECMMLRGSECIMEIPVKCPHCGLFNPSRAQHCDCGYDFDKKALMDQGMPPVETKSISMADRRWLWAARCSALIFFLITLIAALRGNGSFRPVDWLLMAAWWLLSLGQLWLLFLRGKIHWHGGLAWARSWLPSPCSARATLVPHSHWRLLLFPSWRCLAID